MRHVILAALIVVACGTSAAPEKKCGEPGVQLTVNTPVDAKKLAECTHYLGSIRFGDSGFTDVEAMSTLREVDGTINLFRNMKLANVGGLRNLERVGGDLLIHHNGALIDLAGLAKLHTVGGELFISSESSLTSLHGLESLRTVGGNLTIVGSPALPRSEALALAERVKVGGKTEIASNVP